MDHRNGPKHITQNSDKTGGVVGESAEVQTGPPGVCPTGISDLDELLNGGIPEGNTVLISGPPGTGKTTLCLEFICRGAERGEHGAFISVTEPIDRLTHFADSYGFFDRDLVNAGALNFLDLRVIAERLGLPDEDYSIDDSDALLQVIESVVQEYGIQRLVIDSITALCHHLESRNRIRDFLYQLGSSLSKLGCTTFLTSELSAAEEGYSVYGVEESIVDGIIDLDDLERSGDLLRTLQVVKMRGSKHSRTRQVVHLGADGMNLTPLLAFRRGGNGP